MRSVGAMLVLAAATLLPGRAAAADPAAPFEPAWGGLPDRQGWQLMVSPAFPLDWPPGPVRGGRAMVRYAYAMRVSPRVADGAEIAAPWARSVQSGEGRTVVEALQPGLRPLGIQGVRPLRAAELPIALRGEEAASLLRDAADPMQDGLVRDFTCGWASRNGVVAASILPRHPGFVRSLGCPP